MNTDSKWLENWSSKIKNKTVLELGCGDGVDTVVIAKLAEKTFACDLSPPNKRIDGVSMMKIDHSKPLPFKENRFDVVVASLCLHYFEWDLSLEIVKELSRILTPRGLLICRLNSKNDINYGATGYPEKEAGLYAVSGRLKRFFSRSDVTKLFSSGWELAGLEELAIDRYDKEKKVWVFEAVNV